MGCRHQHPISHTLRNGVPAPAPLSWRVPRAPGELVARATTGVPVPAPHRSCSGARIPARGVRRELAARLVARRIVQWGAETAAHPWRGTRHELNASSWRARRRGAGAGTPRGAPRAQCELVARARTGCRHRHLRRGARWELNLSSSRTPRRGCWWRLPHYISAARQIVFFNLSLQLQSGHGRRIIKQGMENTACGHGQSKTGHGQLRNWTWPCIQTRNSADQTYQNHVCSETSSPPPLRPSMLRPNPSAAESSTAAATTSLGFERLLRQNCWRAAMAMAGGDDGDGGDGGRWRAASGDGEGSDSHKLRRRKRNPKP